MSKTQTMRTVFTCDPITQTVANHSQLLLNSLGYDTKIAQNNEELSVKIMIHGKFIARVIEGCNAMSVIILFVSFIVAFAGSFKNTTLFIIVGSILIYILNVFRISFIAIALYEFPEYESLLHNYVFPASIYGFTFLLWFVWIKKFSKF